MRDIQKCRIKGPCQPAFSWTTPSVFQPSRGLERIPRTFFHSKFDADYRKRLFSWKFWLFLGIFWKKTISLIRSIIDCMHFTVIIPRFTVTSCLQQVVSEIFLSISLLWFMAKSLKYLFEAPYSVRKPFLTAQLS